MFLSFYKLVFVFSSFMQLLSWPLVYFFVHHIPFAV